MGMGNVTSIRRRSIPLRIRSVFLMRAMKTKANGEIESYIDKRCARKAFGKKIKIRYNYKV